MCQKNVHYAAVIVFFLSATPLQDPFEEITPYVDSISTG